MNFLSPYWLYALLLAPCFALIAIQVKRTHSRAWKKLIAPRLRKKLVTKVSPLRHWVAFTFSLLAFIFCIVALARPYQGEETTLEKIKSRNILIAIDTSRSMLCQDVSSDRLTAAKSLSLQMLDRFPTDRIGVLAFAGSSNVIAPLTIDHLAVHDTIAQLDTNSLPIEGSNLAEAVSNGVETLKATGKRANALVILSDGEEHDSGIEKAIAEANKAEVQIITIGVGSASGGIIPSQEDDQGKHRNNQGEVVHTKLHENLLRELATKTNGAYTSINHHPESVISAAIDKMDSFEQEGREQVIPHERYAWFLAASVACALLSAITRTHWKAQPATALLLLSFVFLTPTTSDAEESWLKQKQHQLFTSPNAKKLAYKALKEGDYKKAIDHFETAKAHSSNKEQAKLSLALGEAYYKDGNYEQAANAFSQSLLSEDTNLQAKAHYNLGNALYKNQWDKFDGIGETPLKEYLLKRFQKAPESTGSETTQEPLQLEDLDSIEKAFSNASEKYSSSDSLSSNKEAQDNLQSAQEVIKTIKAVREEIKKQQQQKDDQKKDDKQDQKDQKDQDKKDQKKDQDGKKDPKDSQGKEDDKKSSDGDKEKKDEKGKGDKSDDKDQKGKPKPDDKKDGDKKQQDQADKGEKKDPNADQKGDQKQPSKNGEQQGNQQARPASHQPNKKDPKNGYTPTEQQARELLERNADMQDRPATERRNLWINKPEIDW